MSKLTRYVQQIFGSTAGANEMAQIGSLAAAAPLLESGATITPAIAQALSNYQAGLFNVVLGGNSPTIEDLNSLFWLTTRQLAYVYQAGIPEYDASTVYYTNSMCQSGGIVYQSLIDTNLNNAPASSPSDWSQLLSNAAPTIQKFTSGSGTYTTPTGVKYVRVRMVGGGAGGYASGGSAGGGGNTTFGTSLLNAGGGAAAAFVNQGGFGGSASLGSGPIGLALAGGAGGGGFEINSVALQYYISGGSGGASAFGGAGTGADNSNALAGTAGGTNTGGGGGGGVLISGSTSSGYGGGGAGGFVDAIINSPSATYAYSVGGGGAGATGGLAGGAGGSGIIIVEEHYNF